MVRLNLLIGARDFEDRVMLDFTENAVANYDAGMSS